MLTRGDARSNDAVMTTENTFAHTITIPLGVVDARARIALDGTVRLLGHRGHPLPCKLATAAWGVLSTWMIEQDGDDPAAGQTMVDPDGWRELFAHRLQAVPA